MKKTTTLSLILMTAFGMSASAQYCIPTVDYVNSFGAGITNVTLNSNPAINRTSTTVENNGFTVTTTPVSVTKGQTYSLGVTRNNDNLPCQAYDIKVYIDYNLNSSFSDAGENAANWTNVAAGTSSMNFTVPNTATVGASRMRIALKMVAACGHSAVNPCNIPADPLGWHGEIEDYVLNIVAGSSSLNEIAENTLLLSAYPNPFSESSTISYVLSDKMPVVLEVYNILGKKVDVLVNEVQLGGEHNYTFKSKASANGVYFIKIKAGNTVTTQRLIEVR